jgi:Tfp pilus assembly protein PilF
MEIDRTSIAMKEVKKRFDVRRIFIAIMSLLIVSCAGISSQTSQESGFGGKDRQQVIVDAYVQQDFTKAIKLLNKNSNKEAVVILESVIDREKRLPAPFVNLAIAQNRLNDSKSAEKNLLSALKLDSTHPVANNELGLIYRKSGKFTEARIAYENALKNNAGYLPSRKNLGVLCDLYLHDFNCALKQFEKYLELQPNDKTVEIWIADVRRRLVK